MPEKTIPTLQEQLESLQAQLQILKEELQNLQTQLESNTAQTEQSSTDKNKQVSEKTIPENTAESPEESQVSSEITEIPEDLRNALAEAYSGEKNIPEEVLNAIKKTLPKSSNQNSNSDEQGHNDNEGNTAESSSSTHSTAQEKPAQGNPSSSDQSETDPPEEDQQGAADEGNTNKAPNNALDGISNELEQPFQFLQDFSKLIELFTQMIKDFIKSSPALTNAANHIVGPQEEQKTEESKTNELKQAEEPAPTEPTPTPKPTETPEPTSEPMKTPTTPEPTPAPGQTGTSTPLTEPSVKEPASAEPVPAPEPTTERAHDVTIQGRDENWILNDNKDLLIGPGGTYYRDKGTWRSSENYEPVNFTGENGLFNQCQDLRNHITSQTNEDGSVTYFGPISDDPDATIKFDNNGNIDTITMSGPGYPNDTIFQVRTGMVYNLSDGNGDANGVPLTNFMNNNLAHYPGIEAINNTPAPTVASNTPVPQEQIASSDNQR